MRLSSLFMMAAAVMTLAGCGGMNASNSDAPKANEAHEATWVTSHRNALYFAAYTSGRSLRNENVHQCSICHHPELGAPECLSCHVLDPIAYPFECSSCHGMAPVVKFMDFFNRYSSSRRGIPLNQDFITNVKNAVYHKRDVSPAINHDVVFLPLNYTQQDCRRCHDDPTGQDRTLAERHHALMNSNEPWVATEGCFYCHSFSFVIGPDGIPVFDFTPNRNCSSCHN